MHAGEASHAQRTVFDAAFNADPEVGFGLGGASVLRSDPSARHRLTHTAGLVGHTRWHGNAINTKTLRGEHLLERCLRRFELDRILRCDCDSGHVSILTNGRHKSSRS